jgi:hypothetical protein
VVGFALGLTYTWYIDPVEYSNTFPPQLRSDYLHEWIRMTALGYVADQDLERVQSRLEGIPQSEVNEALAAFIEAYTSQGRPAGTMRRLSELAQDLGVNTPAISAYLQTPAPTPNPVEPSSPTPVLPPTPAGETPTPAPSPTPTPLPTIPAFSPYRVLTQTVNCSGTIPQLQVFVQTAPVEGEETEEEEEEVEVLPPEPLAGVVLWLTWSEGADRAVTGLRPWIDGGYADFQLEPDTVYALSIDEPNAPVVSGLTIPFCPSGEQEGTWQVIVEVKRSEGTDSPTNE